MKKYAIWAGMALAVLVLALSITNASWLADNPKGAPKQIANRALAPMPAVDGEGPCSSARIDPPYHRHLANMRDSVLRADRMGAWLVEVDVELTRDGEAVLFAQDTLDCLTDGNGKVSDLTLEQLQALDAGHGYNGDGSSYPFRGRGHSIVTLEEVADALPSHGKLMVHLHRGDAALVDAVLAALKAAGRDPARSEDGFYGDPAAIRLVRERHPDAWAFAPEEARQCASDYIAQGWTGLVPASCEYGTMLISLDNQALLWGWPNRLVARLESVGAKIVIEGPGEVAPGEVSGITLPEQLTEIPASFNGYVWTDDAFNTLPALIPRFDNRTQEEIDASQAALENRRKR